MTDISVKIRPRVSAKYARFILPILGKPPVISPSKYCEEPFPESLNRLNPGRSSTPQLSRTFSASSLILSAHGPCRSQVCEASSDTSSPCRANQFARSQPLYAPIIPPALTTLSCTGDSFLSRAAGHS